MLVIALLGRPNVGKSTLFNRLTRTRDALVANFPGLTRDRQYGYAEIEGHGFIIIDTGGLIEEASDIDNLVIQQSFLAAEEADLVLFMVDGRQGLNAHDEQIVGQLRRMGKPILLVMNKMDGINELNTIGEFYVLGLGNPMAIAASHGRGMNELAHRILLYFEFEPVKGQPGKLQSKQQYLAIAVVGRPNVGKSTLINRLLGKERLVTYDQPGTTRDSINIPMDYNGESVVLIDTAGVKRRGSNKRIAEKFSVIKTLQAIEQANVAVMMLDSREGIVGQDASLLGYILERGCALVLAVNKWDRLSRENKQEIRQQLERKLVFASFADLHFISAKYGTGIFDVLDSAVRAYQSAFKRYRTPHLNALLEDMLIEYQPPVVRGGRIKLRYMHQGGVNPPRFIIHGSQTKLIPENYRRYLLNRIRQQLCIKGTPLQIEFCDGRNPYAGRSKKPVSGGKKKQRKY